MCSGQVIKENVLERPEGPHETQTEVQPEDEDEDVPALLSDPESEDLEGENTAHWWQVVAQYRDVAHAGRHQFNRTDVTGENVRANILLARFDFRENIHLPTQSDFEDEMN